MQRFLRECDYDERARGNVADAERYVLAAP